MILRLLALVSAIATFAACNTRNGGTEVAQPHMPVFTARVERASFGATHDGTPVELFTLSNGHLQIGAMTYGAIITSIRVPDRRGTPDDIVLGFDRLDGYLGASPYFGAIVGRYGNRIARGRFTLDGRTYQLATNDGPNHLHGGRVGFDKVVWHAEPFQHADSGVGVVFTHRSPDGDEGYPGTLDATVTYTLTSADDLIVDYEAATDATTVLNLTQHSYFNLAGEGTGDILQHRLTIDADRFTPVDETLIPTGDLAPVEGTPFDFRQPTAIGARIGAESEQLGRGKGYDHNFVLNRPAGSDRAALVHAARVVEPGSGRTLDVSTTEPGLQFYSGNFLDGTITGKQGHVYGHRTGFCLETQHFPDSPNHPGFPSTVLRTGQPYRSRTVFRFGTEH